MLRSPRANRRQPSPTFYFSPNKHAPFAIGVRPRLASWRKQKSTVVRPSRITWPTSLHLKGTIKHHQTPFFFYSVQTQPLLDKSRQSVFTKSLSLHTHNTLKAIRRSNCSLGNVLNNKISKEPRINPISKSHQNITLPRRNRTKSSPQGSPEYPSLSTLTADSENCLVASNWLVKERQESNAYSTLNLGRCEASAHLRRWCHQQQSDFCFVLIDNK